jgi:hypothetical protein
MPWIMESIVTVHPAAMDSFVIIRLMQFPEKIPGLRLATVIVAIFAVIWISLEGNLWQPIALAAGLTLISAGYLLQRLLGGRKLAVGSWFAVAALAGLLTGLSFGIMVLLLMAVKTGLHGHGPEFSPNELDWVVEQFPLWTVVGLLGAIGLTTVAMGIRRN